MYYPILRGRQFDLIAIREFAAIQKTKKVIPIIEPVKSTLNVLKKSCESMIAHSFSFSLIINPTVGDLVNDNDSINDIIEFQYQNGADWFPCIYYSSRSPESSVMESIKELPKILIVKEGHFDNSILDYISDNNIKFIVSSPSRRLKKIIKNSENVKLIRLDDNFSARQRNADYLDNTEEMLTDEPWWYKEDGFDGFSDFTILDSSYTDSGFLPRAVSIHLSYIRREEEEVWIKHFTSDTHTGTENIQGKFADACAKAIEYFDSEPRNNTHSISELRGYFDEQKYPGLGMVKKISIKHHLELIDMLLSELSK